MIRPHHRLLFALTIFCASILQAGCAIALTPVTAQRPFLHSLFSDHMVLPRDRIAPVWGWTTPGAKVTVRIAEHTTEAVADASGKWMARVGPLPAGGPFTLLVEGPHHVRVEDVLVGDVWLCSGQSNMEMGMGAIAMPDEVARANNAQLRLFTVPRRVATAPQALVNSRWQTTTPQSVGTGAAWNGFSAVCYFFGRELQQTLKIPIGLIHASWGGTLAEAWTSGDALNRLDDFRGAVATLRQVAADRTSGRSDLASELRAWWLRNDAGSRSGLGWAEPTLNVTDWKSMRLPQRWEGAGLPGFDGVVWFRREFILPPAWQGGDVLLSLGPIDDRDTTWVNGVEVGNTGRWDTPRQYRVPGKLLKAGRNVIAVRVLDTGSGGGFYGRPDQMSLLDAREVMPGFAIPLAGDWQFRASTPLAKMTPEPMRLDDQNNVSVLFNGMIANLLPYAIRGAIWYQGESNASAAAQYRVLLPTLMADWRQHFGVGDFPFYITQLASFGQAKADPGQSNWAELREAQRLTALADSNSGLAVTIDVGDANDIHPKDKRTVGYRLARQALVRHYGQAGVHQGPLPEHAEVRGETLRVRFSQLGSGLMVARGEVLDGFALAGANGVFVWAKARIEGDTVVLRADGVAQPVTVRYAWADNPRGNLINREGYPASPFQADATTLPRPAHVPQAN